MSTMQQSRAWQGAPVFSFGFRPFFLAGALYAGIVVALWLPIFSGQITLPTAFSPLTWHAHELLFGYVFAIVAGFLLTAVPNWTGRLPVVGYPLAGLFALWLTGRVAVTLSAVLDPVSLALLTLAFPVALIAAMAREVIIGRNAKNLIVIVVVTTLAVAQSVTQWEHWAGATDPVGVRLGIAAVVTLITVIGGRVTPSFTRNWLAKAGTGREPSPIGRFDLAALLVGAASLVAWALAPHMPDAAQVPVGGFLVGAGLLHLARQARWAPDRVLAEPIVLILHLGYFFVPLGFLLAGASFATGGAVPEVAGIHTWSTGAVGVMTLAVMTRATLGHTGRDIVAGPATVSIYAAALAAALFRIASALAPEHAGLLLGMSALLWCVAFFGFALVYGPMLLTRRV